MGRRVSVLLLIAGAVVAALAVSGVFAAFGDDGPQLGGPVVVTVEPSGTTTPAKEPTPRPSTSPAKKTRGEPVKPPPPKQGGDDDGDDDDDDGDDD
ncbi:hypothetical protein GT755_05185 [Herbidospora sp. NEAU-GS84]|uniref:Small secreted hydrophilic protein n=1 Tax=Herbidospora solisilvae TaxID=2696284 RepID=A0A7C9J1H5_9ACTN|nr:hypothetical protein [Herbidospora solisilvae]NAS21080.1 hypothetical protein [Herbidospora solisilvae]